MSSSELNDFVLNLDRLTRAASLLLNQGQLDVNAVAGKLAYNADDATYDYALSTYDGTITQLVRSSANLNGLSASAASTTNVVVSASAGLGGLTSASTSLVSHTVSSDASLGSINSTATTIPQIFPILDAPLGDLANAATATVTHVASASTELGALTSTMEAVVTHVASAESLLGELTSTANTTPTIKPVFMGSLGSLDANASATVIPPAPPEPIAPGYGSNRPYPSPPLRQPEPQPLPQPPAVVITETPPARPVRVPAKIVVVAQINPTTFSTSVNAKVEWSILEDEAELLLLI